MKIGLICPYVLSRPGGVGSYVKALQTELQSRGHEVKIIAPHPKNGEISAEPNVILLSEAMPVRTPFSTTVDVTYKIDGDEIEECLAREKFDLLHYHEPWMPRLPLEVLARSSCCNIATFHAKRPESVLNRSIEKAAAPLAKQTLKDFDYLTAVSDAAASYVRSLLNGSERTIRIVPNGIDLQAYDAASVQSLPEYDDDLMTILYLGRLEGRKGAIWLLRAFRELQKKHPKTRLLIAGDGPKRKMLEEFVEAEDLAHVEFLGFVSEDHKRRLLKTADLFCSPALYGESFGIVLLEAMAMNTVTICGNNDGYSSVMKDRGRISLVDPQDTDEFAARLELLLFDEDLRHAWSEWAKEYVQQFDYKTIVDTYEVIYNEVYNMRHKDTPADAHA